MPKKTLKDDVLNVDDVKFCRLVVIEGMSPIKAFTESYGKENLTKNPTMRTEKQLELPKIKNEMKRIIDLQRASCEVLTPTYTPTIKKDDIISMHNKIITLFADNLSEEVMDNDGNYKTKVNPQAAKVVQDSLSALSRMHGYDAPVEVKNDIKIALDGAVNDYAK